jgi:hypothetical protein
MRWHFALGEWPLVFGLAAVNIAWKAPGRLARALKR